MNQERVYKKIIGEKCFDNFDYQNISEYTEEDIQRIIKTEGIIKSEKKIRAVIHNAQCFLKVQKEFGIFSDYMTTYVLEIGS